MNKEQFLRALKRELSALPKADLDEVLADYEEYFHDGLASGRAEEEIAKGLGDPKKIARELLAQLRIQEWKDNKSMGNLMRVVLSIVALGSLNLFLAIPMLIFMGMLTASYACSVALIIIGLVCGVAMAPGMAEQMGLNGTVVIDDDKPTGKQVKIDVEAGNGIDSKKSTVQSPPPVPAVPGVPEPPKPPGVSAESVPSEVIRKDTTESDGRRLLEEHEDGELVRREVWEPSGQHTKEQYQDGELVHKEVTEANGRRVREDHENGELVRKEITEPSGRRVTESHQGDQLVRKEVTGADGAHVLVERDDQGNEHVRIEGPDGGKVVIQKRADKEGASVRIRDGKSNSVEIDGLDGMDSMQAKLIGFFGGTIGGALWLWFNIWVTKWVFRGFVRYAKLNVSIIRGEPQANGSSAV
ncbi:DUF1700 domain-containing protein [Chitinivorax sp. B]|uniref:DUF1700 domain-containing protein n=1 Tax=Chitinivorax sp. B TaxID=2502235 RepID=UPI0010F8290B|nr:DUF1700 domain-containing protein [Chitinivorax sp. B]